MACGTGPEFGDYVVFNTTDEPIFVSWVDQQERVVGPIPPGTQWQMPVTDFTQCATGTFIARTSAGREIARRTEPICRDDMWIVRDAGSPPPS